MRGELRDENIFERMTKKLVNKTLTKVRFNEVDSLGIVWHGHYVKFFEDGREAFGVEHELEYMTVYKEGFATPIVKLNIDYKRVVAYGDSVIIETTYIPTAAAKIIFEYKIYLESNKELVASGSTTQVFVTLDRQLHITNPPFFDKWKAKQLKDRSN